MPAGERVERLRGRAGQKQRARRLERSHGLCEMCLDEGRTAEATKVDHTVPLALGGSDEDHNTRNLCRAHHDQVTAEQFGFDVAAGGRGVDRSGRPTGEAHPWNRRSGSTPRG